MASTHHVGGDGGSTGTSVPASEAPGFPSLFGSGNRLTLPGGLHRVTCLRDRGGRVVGLTYRVGRYRPLLSTIFQDVLSQVAQKGPGRSLLIIGPPGAGKTTLLRDIARALADGFSGPNLGASVVVVDTCNEIAGGSLVPHACIGRARRMMVSDHGTQHEALFDALKDMAPRVIVIDEIDTKQDVAAVRSIVQRGVNLVATACGLDLASVLHDPELRPLLGLVQAVTVADEAAARNGTSKTVYERIGLPDFGMVIEVLSQDRWRVHTRACESVDRLLLHTSRQSSGGSGGWVSEGSKDEDSEDRHASGDEEGGAVCTHSQVRRYDYSAEPSSGPAMRTMRVRYDTARAAKRAGAICAKDAKGVVENGGRGGAQRQG